MKTLASLLVAAALVGAASAQDSNQIARVTNGATACAGCNLFQADLSYQNLSDRNLSSARLRQADLTVATLDRTKLRGADLSVANAFGARFQGADLADANLKDTVMVGAWLGGADLTGARLAGANFSGAYLATTRGLTQSQLSAACGDKDTQLPAALVLRNCE